MPKRSTSSSSRTTSRVATAAAAATALPAEGRPGGPGQRRDIRAREAALALVSGDEIEALRGFVRELRLEFDESS